MNRGLSGFYPLGQLFNIGINGYFYSLIGGYYGS